MDPAPPGLPNLFDDLTPVIRAYWEGACERTPRLAAKAVIVAGTREGVRLVEPRHDGKARHCVALCERASVRARLAALGEFEAASMLDQAHDPDRADVVVATAEGFLVAELHFYVGGKGGAA